LPDKISHDTAGIRVGSPPQLEALRKLVVEQLSALLESQARTHQFSATIRALVSRVRKPCACKPHGGSSDRRGAPRDPSAGILPATGSQLESAGGRTPAAMVPERKIHSGGTHRIQSNNGYS